MWRAINNKIRSVPTAAVATHLRYKIPQGIISESSSLHLRNGRTHCLGWPVGFIKESNLPLRGRLHQKNCSGVGKAAINSAETNPLPSNPQVLFCGDIGDFFAPPSFRLRFLEFLWCWVPISSPAEKHVVLGFVNGVVFVPFCRTTC